MIMDAWRQVSTILPVVQIFELGFGPAALTPDKFG